MGEKNNSKKSNEIKITRIYDAPVKIVWDAWVDPEQVAKWWGPRGFTLTTRSKDVRKGGIWNYVMHGPDGTDYENRTLFLEVEKYSRLVYDHGANETQPPLFRVTVNFSEKNGKTKMDMSMALATPEQAEQTRKFIKKAGGDSTWDRLAEYLAETISKKDQFVINRTFDAPIDLMFEVWTNSDHFSKWLAPTGFNMKFIKADIKPGGSTFYVMSNSDESMKMYGKAHYLEINRPHLIKYTQQFSDENGGISRHPMAPTWPETMLTVVNLTEEEPGRTRLTITWEAYGEATALELETFNKAKGGMTQGWTGSFDKLEDYLEEI